MFGILSIESIDKYFSERLSQLQLITTCQPIVVIVWSVVIVFTNSLLWLMKKINNFPFRKTLHASLGCHIYLPCWNILDVSWPIVVNKQNKTTRIIYQWIGIFRNQYNFDSEKRIQSHLMFAKRAYLLVDKQMNFSPATRTTYIRFMLDTVNKLSNLQFVHS